MSQKAMNPPEPQPPKEVVDLVGKIGFQLSKYNREGREAADLLAQSAINTAVAAERQRHAAEVAVLKRRIVIISSREDESIDQCESKVDELLQTIEEDKAEIERLQKLQDAWQKVNLPNAVPVSYGELLLKIAALTTERDEARAELAYIRLQRDRLLEVTWLDLPGEPDESTARWREEFEKGWVRKDESDSLRAQLSALELRLKRETKDHCDFEDQLVKLLSVRPRKSDHDNTDDGRIIERCKELLAKLSALEQDGKRLETIIDGSEYYGSVGISRGPADANWVKWRDAIRSYKDSAMKEGQYE